MKNATQGRLEETMERLTKRTDDGKVVYALLRPGTCVDPIDLLKVWGDRLAAYEDTGLDPKEVAELASPKTVEIVRLLEKMCTEGSAQHMLELFQAEKDGRLVVLDEPRKPLVWVDDAHDSILCPNCNHDLMGGFQEDEYCEKDMYQCPYCGQPIDSAKTLISEEAEAALNQESRPRPLRLGCKSVGVGH